MSASLFSGESLGIYNAHPHMLADSEEVSHPVAIKVALRAESIKIQDYDDRTAQAQADFDVFYTWVDPRLAGWPTAAALPEDLWTPELSPFGTASDVDRARLGEAGWKAKGTLAFTVGGKTMGELVLSVRLRRVTVDCKASADLPHFPLDSHDIVFGVSLGRTSAGNANYTTFDAEAVGPALLMEGYDLGARPTPVDFHPGGDEWVVTSLRWGFGEHHSAASGVFYHDVLCLLHRKRVPDYYLVKAVHPTLICCFLSLAALIIPADELGTRFSVLLTLFLTVFAIQWVTTDRLPKTPFLTRLDKLIASTAMYIVLIALVSMCLRAALRLGVDRDLVHQIELYTFAAFALAFVLGTSQQLLAIEKHLRGRKSHAAATNNEDRSPSEPTFVRRWQGFYWQADVAKDGSVGEPWQVAGDLQEWSGKAQGQGKANATFEVNIEVGNPASASAAAGGGDKAIAS
jgi:hypothetical protein